MTKNPFLRKVHDIRHRYGASAGIYFTEKPACEDCGEKRIAALSVHHVHGKKVDIFKTLCFNCHMLEHSNTPQYTYDDFVSHKAAKDKEISIRSDRDNEIRSLRDSGLTLRAIAVKFGVSHRLIHGITNE